MNFTEVCSLIHSKAMEDRSKQVVCYMHIRLYRELQRSIKGAVSAEAYAFSKSHPTPTILGVPVYLVISDEAPSIFVATL